MIIQLSVLEQQEVERIALTNGEFFPGLSHSAPPIADDAHRPDDGEEKESKEEKQLDASPAAIPAYQQYYFYVQGPLVSPSVKFSEKKSIIGDDDDD